MKQVTLYVTEVPIPVSNDFHLLWSSRCGIPLAYPYGMFLYFGKIAYYTRCLCPASFNNFPPSSPVSDQTERTLP